MPLTLILGCMFAGKSTELLKHKKGKTLAITHAHDTRYAGGITTHSGEKLYAHKCVVLPRNLEGKYDTVLIDEAQFFDDLTGVEHLATHVVVAGLSGDFRQRPFGKILDLIPKASKVIFLTATCTCGKNASFTKRISNTLDLISVESEYIPVCEQCLSD